MLQKALPLDTLVAWDKRLTADVIVFVDWLGIREPGKPIYILEDIFTKVCPQILYLSLNFVHYLLCFFVFVIVGS